MTDRFDKFTERARKVLQLAQEEAQRFNHNYIGTEHLLLGLVRERDGVAAQVLISMGIKLYKVRSAVEFIIGRGDRLTVGEIGLTPRGKRVIEFAVDEARRLNHNYIGTEHLLLGLVRERDGIAAGVMESLGVYLEQVRAQVIEVLKGSSEQIPSYSPPNIRRSTSGSLDETWLHSLLGHNSFTPHARNALQRAQAEAVLLDHPRMGTGHLLLGLLGSNGSVAQKVLQGLGVELPQVRAVVEEAVSEEAGLVTEGVEITAGPKNVIVISIDAAQVLNHHYIGTEHLLLAMVSAGDGLAVNILKKLGIELEVVRTQVHEMLQNGEGEGDHSKEGT